MTFSKKVIYACFRAVSRSTLLARFVYVSSPLVFTCGCVSYPERMAEVKDSIASGAYERMSETLEKVGGDSESLTHMERGRALQIIGSTEKACSHYILAMDCLRKEDEKAVISASDTAQALTSAAYNDTVLDYRAEQYERVMLYNLAALGFLVSGQRDKVNPTVYNLREEIKKGKSDSGEQQIDASVMRSVSAAMKDLKKLSGNLSSSQLCAFSTYFLGVFHESQRDYSNAWLYYNMAFSGILDPGAADLKTMDVHRLRAKGYSPRNIDDVNGSMSLDDGLSDIVIFFEDQYINTKTEQRIDLPLPVDNNIYMVSAAMPTYLAPPYRGGHFDVFVDGKSCGATVIATDYDMLAAKSLEENIPGIIFRLVMRMTTKIAMQAAISNQDQNIGLLVGIFNSFTEQADLREWTLLPARGHIARFRVPAGEHIFSFQRSGEQHSASVDVREDCTTVIHAISVPGRFTLKYGFL